MQHLPWLDIHLVLTLTRTRSLRAASDALGLDVSTLSRRLAALEEKVDGRLFDRSRQGIVPTPLALALVPAAEAMERAANDFERGVEGFERDIAGVVRISMTPSVGDLFLPQLFEGLERAHPRLQLSLEMSDEVVDLQRREADLGLRFVRPSRGELVSKRLVQLTHRILASQALATRLGTVKAWSDLPWILPETGPVARMMAELVRPGFLVTDSVPARLSAVRAGMGVSVMPSFFAQQFGLVPPQLARGLREPTWPRTDVWLVVHAAQQRVPRVAAVARWLAERVPAVLRSR